jgi:dTDP-4-dehydrorhamnose reductase
LLESEKPEAVLNCAAYTDVDGATSNAAACYKAKLFRRRKSRARFKKDRRGFRNDFHRLLFSTAQSPISTRSATLRIREAFTPESKLDGETRARNAYARSSSSFVLAGFTALGGTNFLSVMHRLLAEGKTIKAIFDSYGTPTYC